MLLLEPRPCKKNESNHFDRRPNTAGGQHGYELHRQARSVGFDGTEDQWDEVPVR